MSKMLSIATDLMTVEAFKAFTQSDWDSFAGAPENALIGYGQRYAFILTTEQIIAIDETGEYELEISKELPYGT